MRTLFYTGSSMYPLLRRGDVLLCLETDIGRVGRGDLVVFTPRGGEGLVVHRVVRMLEDGRLVTRGDRCPTEDPVPVDAASFACLARGRVRGYGRRVPLPGGTAGFAQAALYRAWASLRRTCARRLPAAPAVLRSLAAALWRPGIGEVRLEGPHGPETRYVHRGRTVARWIPGLGVFHCRRLYSLVIDPPGGDGRG
ncbi:MAG: S24/S26 family peptidase [Candidatus Fermentibacter sp.]|nr:S24/S26 family peptidase [Candidatus Fermentibacter sp.]